MANGELQLLKERKLFFKEYIVSLCKYPQTTAIFAEEQI